MSTIDIDKKLYAGGRRNACEINVLEVPLEEFCEGAVIQGKNHWRDERVYLYIENYRMVRGMVTREERKIEQTRTGEKVTVETFYDLGIVNEKFRRYYGWFISKAGK